MNPNQAKNQKGYVAIVGIVFLAITLSLTAVLLQYVSTNIKSSRQGVAQAQALQLADAGLDIAVSKLNQGLSYTGETNTALGGGTFTTTVVTVDANTRTITSTGNSTYKGKAVSKTVRANVAINNTVISFRYGVQAGAGGFSLTGGSTINGNVYSNATISATTGVHITGSAVAADPAALSADQTNNTPSTISSCTSSNCITFGNASATQDFAESFKISTATPLNNIQFYLKKVGSPGNLTLRILTDSSGSPGTQLMTGTISSASVTTNFGWVSATLPTTPVLEPSQTYWMVLDGSASSTKYYILGANTDGYANGSAKIGTYGGSWAATSPSNLDGYFQVYLGGGNSMIGGNSYNTGVYVGTTSSDETWAYNVMGATMTGGLYCQTSSFTSKACDTSRSSPTPASMPLSDNNIQDWKDDASNGGTISGDYTVGSAGATLGPKVITGNLTVNGGGTLNLTGTLWVQGNVTVNGGGKVKLDSSYGSNSGVLVTDGYVSLTGGSNFAGSGTAGSYPFVITTSACPAAPGCSGNNAIYLSGGAGTVALIAQNGTVQISGGSVLKAVTAQQIVMDGGATLTYDSGLVNENFYSGPGGSWGFVPGSYAITD